MEAPVFLLIIGSVFEKVRLIVDIINHKIEIAIVIKICERCAVGE